MNLKRSLFAAGIGIIVLILIAAALKWPFILKPFRHNNLGMIAGQAVAQKPSVKTVKQDKQRLVKLPDGASIPVLMYHSISTIPGNNLGVPVQQFTEEMDWLHRQNYHPISMDEFYNALVNKAPLPEKPILLTFDDGYEDNYTSAWPILHQNGFKATFFIVSSHVGPGMMTWDQLGELAKQGNSVESHTVHHLDLSTLSEKQQEYELSVSKQEIENHLGISVQALCFPSGRYNDTTLSLMTKLGYQLGFTTKPGKVHMGDSLLELHRVRIPGGMALAGFMRLFP